MRHPLSNRNPELLRGPDKAGPIALASLLSAVVNQQGSDVTEGEGRRDRDERLLVERARLGPSLHASAPDYLPRPLSRFVRRGASPTLSPTDSAVLSATLA